MFRALISHLLLMIVGYFRAVLTAVGVAGFIVVNVIAVFQMGSVFSVLFEYWNTGVGYFEFALWTTVTCAFPGWLIAVISAETLNMRRKYWFAVAGALNALLAAVINGDLPPLDLMRLEKLAGTLPLVCSGFFAGLAYWRHAGWRSGFWRGPHAGSIETNQMSGKYVAKVETVFTRMFRIFVGLSLGNLAASSVYWFLVMVPFVEGTHHALISHISNIVDITSELGAYAFYPALVIFLYAEFTGNRSWRFHALGGMAVTLTVFGVLSALHNFPPSAEDGPILLATSFAFALCGATNGLVYWLIAVPEAGKLVRKLVWPTSVSAGS